MKSQLKTINFAYEKLYFVFDTAWTNYAEQLRERCLAEEREHRKSGESFSAYHTADTISANQCAKLFAVKRIAEYLSGQSYPTAKDYLHIHKSCFIAAAITDEFGDKIRAAWKDFDLSVLASLDYSDFVKVKGGTNGN